MMEWAIVEGTGESVAETARPRVGDLWVISYPISWGFGPCLVHVDNKGPMFSSLGSLPTIEDAKYCFKTCLHAIVTQGAPSSSFSVSQFPFLLVTWPGDSVLKNLCFVSNQ